MDVPIATHVAPSSLAFFTRRERFLSTCPRAAAIRQTKLGGLEPFRHRYSLTSVTVSSREVNLGVSPDPSGSHFGDDDSYVVAASAGNGSLDQRLDNGGHVFVSRQGAPDLFVG